MALPQDDVKLRILVIDDDDLVRLSISRILQKQGHTVFEARNGVAGTELFRLKTPDIVITDMLMPDKEGLETISELKQMQPDVKIIAMSGGGMSQNMSFLQLAQKLGAGCTINKPIRPDDLFKAIATVMQSA